MNIAFFKPFVDESEPKLIAQALKDENFIEKLELEVAQYFGVKHVISTNNSTAAKHLALCAMEIKRGDKILCPVNSFVSTPEVIRYFDAEPIFVDCDKDDFCLDPNALEHAIKANQSKKLKAVFVTHIAGLSADMDAIRSLCAKYELKIINDSTLGVKYNGRLIGKDDFISCFGLQAQSKGAISAAGLIITNDDEIAQKAKILRSHAMIRKEDLSYIYDVEKIGQRYDLSALCAAFSLAQFRKLETIIKAQQEIAAKYNKFFEKMPHIKIPKASKEHIYSQYIIKIDRNRDNFAKNIIENGIEVSLHYIPLHLLSYYRNKYNYKIIDFPNALGAYSQVLSLPIYPSLKDEQIDYICSTLRRIACSHV